jgi:hypothetical protein
MMDGTVYTILHCIAQAWQVRAEMSLFEVER